MPGTQIAAGATAVSFYAASRLPGQVVKFKVGGISDETLPYADTLNIDLVATLGTSLERFSIPLGDASYDRVLSAFSWHIERAPGQDDSIALTLDDVRWE